MDTTSPYNIIVQQQIDIVAKCQKEVLDGKENSAKLDEAIRQLCFIDSIVPNKMERILGNSLSGFAGGYGVSGVVSGGRLA